MKYKVCVYAISKNEEKFVERWYNSVKEADYVCVLDTGSTDNTVVLLREMGARVEVKTITPWRFDVARNESMKLIPNDTDICVCIDLDEVLNKGWRNALEQSWTNITTRGKYLYNWSLDDNDNPLVSFYSDKIHKNKDYVWMHPVHEVLMCTNGIEVQTLLSGITLNHYPDSTKSRQEYLPLLELSVKLDPEDDRNMHYLGREYMYYGRYEDAISTLIRHLSLKKATWRDERCASMRFIARCYNYLKDYKRAKVWYELALIESPYLREPYIEYAIYLYEQKHYNKALTFFKKGLKITNENKTYITESFCNNNIIYDYMAICYYQKKNYKEAYKYCELAYQGNREDERLKENLEILKKLKES